MTVRAPRLTYANVASTLALVLALSGAAYAGTQLPKNSVKSKHIKDGQVQTADVKDNGLTGTDIAESSLAKVPSAASADSAATAGSATTAGTADDAAKLGGKPASDYALRGSEAWTGATLNEGTEHDPPGPWCRWESYGSGFATAAYYRDPSGVVHLRGLVKAVDGYDSGSGLPPPPGGGLCGEHPQSDLLMFTLPAGYRPDVHPVFSIASNNAPGRVDVNPDGQVTIYADYPTWDDAKTWVSLDGISFRCAPAGSNGCP